MTMKNKVIVVRFWWDNST